MVETVFVLKVANVQEIRDLLLTSQNRQAEVTIIINAVTRECARYVFSSSAGGIDDGVNVLKPTLQTGCHSERGRWLKCLEQDPVVWKVTAGTIHPVDLDNDVAIGGTVSLGKLTVHGDDVSQVTTVIRGAAGQISDIFDVESFAGTKLVRVSAAGFVGIGTTPDEIFVISNGTDGTGNARVKIKGGAPNTEIQVFQFGGGAGSDVDFEALRARGTEASPTTVLDNDEILTLGALGFDGTAFHFSAEIKMDIDGTVSAGVVPGNIRFITTNASGVRTERVVIDSDGLVFVGKSVNIGSVTPTAGIGDLRTGTGAGHEMFYQASTGRLFLEDAAGNTNHSIRPRAGDTTVFNERGHKNPFRVEGDTLPFMFYLEADPDTENIAFLTTVMPDWKTGDRIIFLGDASTVPTAQGASGLFVWSTSSILTLAGGFIANELGLNADSRIESTDEDHVFAVDAGLNNLVFCHGGGSMPAFNTMDGGVFFADVNVAPIGNPTGGGYMYSASGAGTWRGSGGTTTTFAFAEPHHKACGLDFGTRWQRDDGKDFAICYPCLMKELERLGVDRPKVMICDHKMN